MTFCFVSAVNDVSRRGFVVSNAQALDERRKAACRLVEAPQCQTADQVINKEFLKHKFAYSAFLSREVFKGVIKKENLITEFVDGHKKNVVPSGVRGAKAVIEYRAWSDEYRVRTAVEVSSGSAPVAKTGARISDRLTDNAAKKIGDSSAFMDATRGGFKTFITGTFDAEVRKLLKSGETSIQREVSRSMEALKKIYYRGFLVGGKRVEAAKVDYVDEWKIKRGGFVKAGINYNGYVVENDFCEVEFKKERKIIKGGFAYCWVVEIPKNVHGEDNPHVHILVDWKVERKNFDEWAKRLEAIWSNGMFNLQKIKKTSSAGAYLLKAIGYLKKGSNGSQGIVRGNRYGISEHARAPLFKPYGEGQLNSMGQLISECFDHISERFGHLFRNRKKLSEQLQSKNLSNEHRKKIGKELELIRKAIKKIPLKATRYQVILSGWGAAQSFFSWSRGENTCAEWLPAKIEGDLIWREGERPKPENNMYFTELKRRFGILREKRRALSDNILSKLSSYLFNKKQSEKDSALSAFNDYEIYCNLSIAA